MVAAASLVSFPLLLLVYDLLYPAYGALTAGAMVRSINGHTTITTIADVFAFAGSFLAVPATLAIIAVLGERSPRLTLVGGAMSLAGWIAVVGVLMSDVVAIQIARGGTTPGIRELFGRIMASPTMLTFNGLALLHVVGGTLLGIALLRTRQIPRWAGLAATISPGLQLALNVAGVVRLDPLTWLALAAAYACVARIIMRAENIAYSPVSASASY